jgi:hypothetical protein
MVLLIEKRDARQVKENAVSYGLEKSANVTPSPSLAKGSILLAHLLASMLRVGDELAVLGVHHKVQI